MDKLGQFKKKERESLGFNRLIYQVTNRVLEWVLGDESLNDIKISIK